MTDTLEVVENFKLSIDKSTVLFLAPQTLIDAAAKMSPGKHTHIYVYIPHFKESP